MKDELFKYIEQHISLTPNETEELIRLDLIKSYRKGDVLLRAGEFCNMSYFVLKGCVRSYYIVDGEEKTTAFYTEWQGIMPQCCTTKTASEYYLACVENSVLSVSTTDMEQSFFEKFPRFESLCRVLSEKMLADNQMSFERYMISTPEQRYLYLVEERPELLQRVPQYQIASFLGVKPESLSRIRKRIAQSKKS
ncbi:MAG: cyclic nucleotide-binding domain-containing protein [Ignavibacteria bacterium]|nr:cyclic nucleotide-binding domain-containing protein [Ignavibacteria bacterium]